MSPLSQSSAPRRNAETRPAPARPVPAAPAPAASRATLAAAVARSTSTHARARTHASKSATNPTKASSGHGIASENDRDNDVRTCRAGRGFRKGDAQRRAALHQHNDAPVRVQRDGEHVRQPPLRQLLRLFGGDRGKKEAGGVNRCTAQYTTRKQLMHPTPTSNSRHRTSTLAALVLASLLSSRGSCFCCAPSDWRFLLAWRARYCNCQSNTHQHPPHDSKRLASLTMQLVPESREPSRP